MFGNDSGRVARMVEKCEWDKIDKKLDGLDEKSRLELATACGKSTDEKAVNFLIGLLNDSNENVVLEAVKSLGQVGNQSAKTHLFWLLDHLSCKWKNSTTLRNAVQASLVQIGNRR